MRKIVLLSILLLLITSAFAQNAWVEMMRSDIRTQKVTLMTDYMQFTEEEGKVFWPLYREYDNKLSAILDKRVALIGDYLQNFDKMTDEKAKELGDRLVKINDERMKLWKDSYKKISKKLSPIKALKFYMFEKQVERLIDLQISAELPFIEEKQTQ
jgi:hypothetical protein